MKNDLIIIAVERMSNGNKLRSSTALPMSIFVSSAEHSGVIVWDEILFLMDQLDEKETNEKLNDKP